jgi:hypothetical protein
MIVAIVALVTLLLTPWTGPSLAAAPADGAKYRLAVHGLPAQRTELRVSGLPAGWVASFCTHSICSPMRYTMHLDSHGAGVIEFQVVRLDQTARRHARVTITSDDGGKASIAL